MDLANKGIQLAPGNIHLRDTRGVIFSNMPGKLNEAREDFQQAVELAAPASPAAANALLKLARVCARLEDWTLAADYARKAKQIDSQEGLFSPQQRAEIDKLSKGQP